MSNTKEKKLLPRMSAVKQEESDYAPETDDEEVEDEATEEETTPIKNPPSKRKGAPDGEIQIDGPSSQRRKESKVWRFYDRNADRIRVCKICQKNFSFNTATSALRKHLIKHFGDQTETVLSTAQTAMEVTISPSTNTITVTGIDALVSGNPNDVQTMPITRSGRSTTAKPSIYSRMRADVGPLTAPLPDARAVFPLSQHTSLPSAKSEGDSSSPNKGHARWSAVWKHFVKLDDGRPQCKLCNYTYSVNASTSGLRRHLDGHERGEGPSKPGRKPNPDGSGRTAAAAVITSAYGNLNSASKAVSQKTPITAPKADDMFLETMINQHLPISEVVEDFGAVYRAYTHRAPDQAFLEGKVRAWYTKKKGEVKQFIAGFGGKISLSMELFTAANKQVYLIVTAHMMSDNWESLRFVLDCVVVSPDVMPEIIKDHLAVIVAEYECESKVVAITTGDEQVDEAFRLYNAQLISESSAAVSHVECIGVGLAQCVQPILDGFPDQIDRVRRFLKTLLNTRKTAELQTNAGLLLQDYHELKMDSPNNWCSTVVMIDSAVLMRTVIDDTISKNEHMFDPLTAEDWTILELIVAIVGNFHLAALESKTDYPSLSEALVLMDFLTTHHLNALVERETDMPTWWRTLARETSDRAQEFMNSVLTDVYFIGTVLDPRHKLTTLPLSVTHETVEGKVRSIFARYTQTTSTSNSTPSSAPSSASKTKSLMSTILKKTQSTVSSTQIDELNQYLYSAVEQAEVDPLKWWEDYKKIYPTLAQMAKDYLAIPATAVPSVQLFVKEKDEGRLRNRLDEESMLMYVCLKSWNSIDFSQGVVQSGVDNGLPHSTKNNGLKDII